MESGNDARAEVAHGVSGWMQSCHHEGNKKPGAGLDVYRVASAARDSGAVEHAYREFASRANCMGCAATCGGAVADLPRADSGIAPATARRNMGGDGRVAEKSRECAGLWKGEGLGRRAYHCRGLATGSRKAQDGAG